MTTSKASNFQPRHSRTVAKAKSDRRLFFIFVIAGLLTSSCAILDDNGTHLAFVLEEGAKTLSRSSANESVVLYETLDGKGVSYYVEITPSLGDENSGVEPTDQRWSSYLVVSGKTSGGTSYHNRFVFVPKRLHIEKNGEATEVVLRKNKDRIEVVELR